MTVMVSGKSGLSSSSFTAKTKPPEWDCALRTKRLRARFAGRMSSSTSIILFIIILCFR